MKFNILAQIANATTQKITQHTVIIPPQKLRKNLKKWGIWALAPILRQSSKTTHPNRKFLFDSFLEFPTLDISWRAAYLVRFMSSKHCSQNHPKTVTFQQYFLKISKVKHNQNRCSSWNNKPLLDKIYSRQEPQMIDESQILISQS